MVPSNQQAKSSDTMGRSSPHQQHRHRYRMQEGSASSPPTTPDMMLSYSSSSVSTGSTSIIFPGIPKSPDRDSSIQWVGQPLIPRRITAKKKMRVTNTGYISPDSSSSDLHHHTRPRGKAVISDIPIRLQPRFSGAYKDDDGNVSTTSSLTWERQSRDGTTVASDEKLFLSEQTVVTTTTSTSSGSQKLYLKTNRRSSSHPNKRRILENILENNTPPPSVLDIQPSRGRSLNREEKKTMKKHNNRDAAEDGCNENNKLELDRNSEKEREAPLEQHHEGKKHKRGRRKSRCRGSEDDKWINLLTNMYQDSIDDIKRGCNADAITDLMNQGLSSLSCEIPSWCHQQQDRRNDEPMIYINDTDVKYVYENDRMVNNHVAAASS